MTGTIELSEYVIDAIANAVVKKMQEPKQVELEGDGYAYGTDEIVYDFGKCPNCGWEFEEDDKDWEEPYCCHCGQKLKWFDNEAEGVNEKCASCNHCEVCAFSESETAKAEACDFYDAGNTGHCKWIPVSERLPKAGEYDGDVAKYYLVQNEYGDMLVARYTHSEYWEQMYQHKPIADEIVAWMPLPEPYKKDKVSTI